MLVYLLRHGETDYNAEQRYQGSLDIPLSANGKKKLFSADFCPEVVYTSHLRRTQETAQIIFPGAKLIAVRDFREMSFGDYEGRSKSELINDPDHDVWLASGFTGHCPNEEERHEQFVRRTCDAFSVLLDDALQKGEKRLVIVAHGGTQMSVMSAFVGGGRKFGEWLTGNGGGYILDCEGWQSHKTLALIGEVEYSK